MRKDWEVKKLGDLSISLKNGLTIKQDRSCCGIPVTRIETLSNGVFNRDKLGYANIYDKEQYCNYILDDKDLLISHINSKQYVGRTVLYRKMENEYIIHGMNLLRLKLNRELTFPEFIVYYFKSSYIKEQIRKYRKDAVNQSSISINDIKKIRLLLPPLQTQGQIVEELNCLTSIIEKQKKQLEELDNLAQSIFYDMFGDPIENEKGWVKNELQNICIINPPKKEINSILFNSDDDVSFLPMEDLDSYALHFKPIKCRALSEVKNNYTYFSEGDIVMAKVTPCFENGKIGIVTNLRNEIGFGSSELLVYRSKGDVLQVYLYFVLSSESFHLFGHNNLNGVSGLRRLTKKASHCFMIPIPPLSLQQKFASKIEAIEKQKELIKKSIKETEDLFNSRMDYYFN